MANIWQDFYQGVIEVAHVSVLGGQEFDVYSSGVIQ